MLDNKLFKDIKQVPVPGHLKQKINLSLDVAHSESESNTVKVSLPFDRSKAFPPSLVDKLKSLFDVRFPALATGMACCLFVVFAVFFQSNTTSSLENETIANVNTYIEEAFIDFSMPEFDDSVEFIFES